MSSSSFDPIRVLDVLTAHGVRFVVIGGFAGRLWGSNLITEDLAICYAYDRKNRTALAAALRDLGAHPRNAAENAWDVRTLESQGSLVFETPAGILECVASPAGSGGFPDLIRGSVEMTLDSARVRVVALEDLIRMKRLSARPDDLIELEILGALRDEIQQARPDSHW